jgi:hypothetical protein
MKGKRGQTAGRAHIDEPVVLFENHAVKNPPTPATGDRVPDQLGFQVHGAGQLYGRGSTVTSTAVIGFPDRAHQISWLPEWWKDNDDD